MNRGSRYFDGNWYCLCGDSGTTDEEWEKHIAELPSIEHLMINGREHELLEENKELKREIQENKNDLEDQILLRRTAVEINKVLDRELAECQTENVILQNELRTYHTNSNLFPIGNEQSTEKSRSDAGPGSGPENRTESRPENRTESRPENRTESRPENRPGGQRRLNKRRNP